MHRWGHEVKRIEIDEKKEGPLLFIFSQNKTKLDQEFL